jgi:hypothetical protein
MDGRYDLVPCCAPDSFQEHIAATDQCIAAPLRSDSVDQQNTQLEFRSNRACVDFLSHLALREFVVFNQPCRN